MPGRVVERRKKGRYPRNERTGEKVETVHAARPASWPISHFLAVRGECYLESKGGAVLFCTLLKIVSW